MAASFDSLPLATMIHMVTIKLSSTNFLLWKRQVIPMLTSFDLLGFVNGTEVAPLPTIPSDAGAPIPNPAYTKWLSTDQRLLGVLFSTLSEEAMAEVVECTTSCEAWMMLEAAFSNSSISRVHQLREELLSLCRGSLSVKDYGARFKGLCDQLSAIGKPVDDSDKSHWFFRGLGSQFANFADTRMSMRPVLSFSVLLHQVVVVSLAIHVVKSVVVSIMRINVQCILPVLLLLQPTLLKHSHLPATFRVLQIGILTLERRLT